MLQTHERGHTGIVEDRSAKSVEILRTADAIRNVQAEWEGFLQNHAGDHTVWEQPFFMLGKLASELKTMTPFVVVLRDQGIRCIAPFYLDRRKIPLRVGPIELPTRKVTFLRLIGERVVHGKDCSVTENIGRLLTALQPCESEFDVIWLPELDLDGDVRQFFHEAPRLARDGHRLVMLCPEPETVQLINLPSSFEEYMAGFKGEDRRNRKRHLRKLESHCGGAVALTEYSTPREVTDFLARAEKIRNKSWKANEFGPGRYSDEHYVRLHEAIAERGWVRGYTLTCGDRHVAYLIGYMYSGTFIAAEWGYDNAMRSLSPGVGLILKMLQHFCESLGGCRVLLLPTDSRMKRSLGNGSYRICRAVIVRNGSFGMRLRFGLHRILAHRAKSTVEFARKIRAWARKSG